MNFVGRKISMNIRYMKRLCTSVQIKSVFKFETYLDVINDFNERQRFSNLQMSAHNLEVDAGLC